jgi:hypothetical protein
MFSCRVFWGRKGMYRRRCAESADGAYRAAAADERRPRAIPSLDAVRLDGRNQSVLSRSAAAAAAPSCPYS